MSKNKEDLCIIIPARSGSKGIPNKNIKDLCGKSLLHRTLESAVEITNIRNICLSTNSEKYFIHIKDKYLPVFHKRSNELSGDQSLAIDVWKDAIRYLNSLNNIYRYSVFLEPTSPIRNTDWINQIVKEFKSSNYDLWMSVKETDTKYRLEKQFTINDNGDIKNLFENNDKYSIRQNSKKTYHKDGVFYIARNEYILNTKFLLDGNIKGIVNNYKS
ncbi:acylneuraminate cytidylyltransferase family protein, partial [Prochlorococcus sp. AH-716-P20]|nr:acylneuraminate cytidylyltransferase family protein [Prochlorococcus sp. AH-716-P20]